MKKFYTVLTACLLSIAGLQAQHSITLNIDDPAAAEYKIGYSGTVTSFESETTVINFDADDYSTLYIYPAGYSSTMSSDYKIISVKDEDDYEYKSSWAQYAYISLNESNAGKTLTITTANKADLRTASVNIELVGNPEDITSAYSTNERFTLVEGQNTISFDPTSEVPLQFSHDTYGKKLYLVQHNGETVTTSYSYYNIEANDGDNIFIQIDYPEHPTPVNIELPEGCEDMISSATVDGVEVTNFLDEDFTVQAGTKLRLYFNDKGYKVDYYTVNGKEIMAWGSSIEVEIGMDDVTIAFTQYTKYEDWTVTLTINDTEHAQVYNASYANPDALLTLVAGEATPVIINSKQTSINITTDSDYCVESVYDNVNQEDLRVNNGYFSAAKDGNYTITIAKINRDKKFVVYCHPSDQLWEQAIEITCETEGQRYWINQGEYTDIPFYSGDGQFQIKGQCISYYGTYMYAYINDEEVEKGYDSQTYFYYSPNDGDVVKYYTTTPASCALTFDYSGSAADNVSQTFDTCTEVAGKIEAPKTVLEGTLVEIALTEEEAELKVSLDGEDLTADEFGVYSFSATTDHTVTITATSAVESVSAEAEATDNSVYNLQGIKLLDNANDSQFRQLPAGVYIVNGKKTVIR